MPFFRKRRDELKELQSDGDYGFPELEALKQNFDKIRAELAVKESMNSMEQLPDLPDSPKSLKSSATTSMIPTARRSGQDMPELPKLPELPEDNPELYREPVKLKSTEKLKTKLKAFKTTTAKKPKQLFMRIDSFKEILDSVEVIKEKIEEVGLIMQKLKEIREKEGTVIKQWDLEIQELKTKLETIGNTLEEVQ